MTTKVKRTLTLMAIAAALFTISDVFATPKNAAMMVWVRGASAGFALAGIFGFMLIIGEEIKLRRQK